MTPPIYSTYAEEVVTVADSAVGVDNNASGSLWATPPPDRLELFVASAQLRYRLDGTAPTSAIGELLNPFDRLTLTSRSDMANFKAIRTGATSATIRIRYQRAH